MEYKNMKKIIILIIISLLIPTTVMARNISVPQAINIGDILIGKTNGSYSPISGTTTMASTTGWIRSGNNVYTASSSYNVGIGTTTPDANLDVQSSGEGTSYGLKIRNPNDKTKYFSIYPDTGGQTGMNIGGSGNPLKFQLLATFYSGVSVTGGQSVELQSNNNGYSSIMASASDSRNMLFKTNLVNRMIIDSNGNVGIGTTTPWSKLSVQGTYGSTTPLFSIASTTSSIFATSSLFTVLANGNVGIGTSTPYSNLSVVGTVVASNYVSTTTTASRSLFTDANKTFVTTGASAALLNSLSDETGSGVVVFGTSPTIATPRIASMYGGTAVSSSLTLNSTTGVGTSDFIKFGVGSNGGTEAMRIITNGNIGIGTTTPATKLDINGTMRSQIAASTTVSCTTALKGTQVYSISDDHFYGCRSTGWTQLDN